MNNTETTVTTTCDSISLNSETINAEESTDLPENSTKSGAIVTSVTTLKLPLTPTTSTTNTLPKIAPKPQVIKPAGVAGSKIVYIKSPNGTAQQIRIGGPLLGTPASTTVVHSPNIAANAAGAIQLIKTADGFLQIKNKNMISVQKPVTPNVTGSPATVTANNPRFVVKSGTSSRILLSTPSTTAQVTKSIVSPTSAAATQNSPTTAANTRTLTVSQAQQMGLLTSAKLKELVSAANANKTTTIQTTVANSVPSNKQSLILSTTVQPTSTPSPTTGSTTTSSNSGLAKAQPTILNKGIKAVQQVQNPSQKVLIQTSNATSGTLSNNISGQNSQIRAVNLGGKNLQYVRVLNSVSGTGGTSINSSTVNSKTTSATTNGRQQPVFVQRKIVPQGQVAQQKIVSAKSQQFVTKKLEVTPIALPEGNTPNRFIKKEVSNVTQSKPQTYLLNNTQKSVMNAPIDIKPILNNQDPISFEITSKATSSPSSSPQKVIYRTYKISEEQKPKSPSDSQQTQTLYSNLKYPSPEPADGIRRKHCNCTKSQCLKLYCDCFASGEYCSNCNCKECSNTLEKEDERQKAIKICLERNPHAFKPKIGKARDESDTLRRHTKGCNCKRSGCLKNYCECYEAKIVCSGNCKCIGCRNVDESFEHNIDHESSFENQSLKRANDLRDDATLNIKEEVSAKKPCNFITPDVIEATIQCVIAQADDCLKNEYDTKVSERKILEEFGRCLVEIIDFSKKNNENNENSENNIDE